MNFSELAKKFTNKNANQNVEVKVKNVLTHNGSKK